MVINGKSLVKAAPIKDMLETKVRHNGVSHGLAEVGYDIRIKQDIHFKYRKLFYHGEFHTELVAEIAGQIVGGKFCLASAMEEFQMPCNLLGIVHDKSTWARKGLSVFNTVIEPGWKGFLTLELVYHGSEPLHIPAGSGIAQVVFHETALPALYTGKYQNQADEPVPSVFE